MSGGVTVAELAALVGGRLVGASGAEVVPRGIAHDSRAVRIDDLFCCVPGARSDGHEHAPGAVAAGAVALLVERELPLGVPQILVPDVRRAMGPAAASVYGDPSRALTVVGVTGTNGKTTTTFLLRNIFEAAGRPSAVSGTLTGARTTPEAPELQGWLAAQRAAGVEAVAMEVSSHALDLHRVDGCHFAVSVFTNLSRDHLDHHGTMDAYFAAKASLFTPALTDHGVVNVDDPWGRRLADAAAVPVIEIGMHLVDDLAVGLRSSTFRWRGQAVQLGIGGDYNVRNALGAAEAAVLVGIAPDVVAAGLGVPVEVPGRFELVDAGQPFTVLVDYAHTPDALAHVLAAASAVAEGRVHVVFGCGGDRDATKRAPMGQVAAEGADRVVLTADNSRGEPTEAIIAAVRTGFDTTAPRRATDLLVEPDRRRAIALALDGAAAGDVVVIAGKGHETTQTIGATVEPFDDRDIARAHLGGPTTGGGAA